MLVAKNLTKRFGGLTAVDNVSFTVEEGEIFGIIGPNGSGKTTIFNLISGYLDLTSGSVEFEQKDISNRSPDKIATLGISRTFQITSILSDLTVEQNILAGLFSTIKTNILDVLFRTKKFYISESEAEARINEILKLVGLEHRKHDIAKDIAPVEQRKLMIAIALAKNPRLLMLDEPAAGTTREEQNELINIIKKINETGVTILIIEHHMHIMMNLCNKIVALNFGKKIAEGTPQEIQNHKDVIEAYLGSDSNAS